MLIHFVEFYLNGPKSVHCLEIKGLKSILFFVYKEKQEGEERNRREEARGSGGGGGGEVTTFLSFLLHGAKGIESNICQHSLSLLALSLYCLFLSSQKSLFLCFHSMTGNCHPKFENSGRNGVRWHVCVCWHVFM